MTLWRDAEEWWWNRPRRSASIDHSLEIPRLQRPKGDTGTGTASEDPVHPERPGSTASFSLAAVPLNLEDPFSITSDHGIAFLSLRSYTSEGGNVSDPVQPVTALDGQTTQPRLTGRFAKELENTARHKTNELTTDELLALDKGARQRRARNTLSNDPKVPKHALAVRTKKDRYLKNLQKTHKTHTERCTRIRINNLKKPSVESGDGSTTLGATEEFRGSDKKDANQCMHREASKPVGEQKLEEEHSKSRADSNMSTQASGLEKRGMVERKRSEQSTGIKNLKPDSENAANREASKKIVDEGIDTWVSEPSSKVIASGGSSEAILHEVMGIEASQPDSKKWVGEGSVQQSATLLSAASLSVTATTGSAPPSGIPGGVPPLDINPLGAAPASINSSLTTTPSGELQPGNTPSGARPSTGNGVPSSLVHRPRSKMSIASLLN
ncbi:hypothetical protein MBM_08056 [Drepanopeziza brunnea f. sp. 'multigermtubi' MB_m1]|uniref:Uncharacterized protein n=1 Tax=Marssonina brunnea f. sp. multigermtubi (strain MB_m1) TaxID=1072389 RepID=K1W9C8_MARBU|nr:uncharacterized protein MBM_08056 [Drepanopeziza brunnea f. sp. 'multigermtubi' MB_m1]EKD13855.1 hypothetical protein MBM_08056 [Drepanopeziza brunnea f. sp. 'multigermtubi' MB_m1]